MQPEHWPDVAAIYAEGIATGDATFETVVPSWAEWDASHLVEPRCVAVDEGVLGWAAMSPVSDRCVYGGVAEASVYVAANARGKGVGRSLLDALIAQSEQTGVWTIQAGVFAQNVASLALLDRCGFRIVGVRERLGRLNGSWRDVVLLERRSDNVGISTD
jgi:phosphinothricin acetyltransferase